MTRQLISHHAALATLTSVFLCRRSARAARAAALLACVATTASTLAQSDQDTGTPTTPPAAAPTAQAAPDASPSRDEIAERLRDRIAQMDQIRARLASALERVENGDDLDNLPPFGLWGGPDAGRGFARGEGRGEGPGEGRDGFRGDFRGGFDRPGMRPHTNPDADPSGGDMPRPFRRAELSAGELKEIRAIIDEHMPTLAERLRVAEADSPETAERFFARLAPRFADLLELKRDAPELVEVRIAELQAGMAIVGASRELRKLHEEDPGSDAVAAQREKIRRLLGEQFDLHHRIERHRLESRHAELEESLARFDERIADRDRFIEDHLARVLDRVVRDEPRGDRRRRGEGRETELNGTRRDRPAP